MKRKIRATRFAKVQTQAVGLEGPVFYAKVGEVIEGDEAALAKMMERSSSFEWVEEVPTKKQTAKKSGKE